MEFSIFLSHERNRPAADYADAPYRERLEQALLAEELGYDVVWVPEHHLIQFIQTPNALMLAVYIGMRTRIRVGTMATLLTVRHPLIVAGEIALADQLLEGRLELGVGRGAYPFEFDRLQVPFDESRQRFDEALEILRGLWTSERGTIAYYGQYFKFDEAPVWPQPRQRPHPPIWIAAMTPPSIDRAAREGLHVSTWPFIRPISAVEQACQVFHTARQEAGIPRGQAKLAVLRHAAPTRTRAELASRVEQALVNQRIFLRLRTHEVTVDPTGYVVPEPFAEEPTPEETARNLFFGDPQECLEKVHQYDELGVDQLMLLFDFGPTQQEVLEGMRLFAEEVIQPFRAWKSSKK